MNQRNNQIGSELIQTFENDVNLSSNTKQEVLKFLSIVVGNLFEKPEEPKYRQLRLQNAKIQRYTSHAPIMAYLQQVLGFEQLRETNSEGTLESMLRIVDLSRAPSSSTLRDELQMVTTVLNRIDSLIIAPLNHPKVISNSSSTSSLQSDESSNTKLTEKQKARKLTEEREALQKVKDEQARKRTIQQLQNDKHVRANDPNWKPSVSAAAAKSGDSMSTFRDKFGEN
jgi:PUB domain